MNSPFLLVSHALCLYVQRVAIVLIEKGLAFERRDIDLANKPDWFLQISPLGKTPVLLVGQEAIFESAVICEYLDETTLPQLHPSDPMKRAKHRSWIEFGSMLLNAIAAFYNAPDEAALQLRAQEIGTRLGLIEGALAEGPFFDGNTFSIVDAAFGPVFRYFDPFDGIGNFGFCEGLPKVESWRKALAARPSVAAAVRPDYPELLHSFLLNRPSALSQRISRAGLGIRQHQEERWLEHSSDEQALLQKG